MTIIRYNKKNLQRYEPSKPSIKIHRKDANCINTEAVKLTGYNPGDCVTLINQITKDGPYEISEWYLTLDEHGYPLKGKADRGHLIFSCLHLSRIVLDKNDLYNDVYSILLATKPTTLEDGTTGWAILFDSVKP